MLDDSSNNGLSKKRYQRDRKTWACDEATTLYELLSYTRRYWRKALKRKTRGRATVFAVDILCLKYAAY